jgi:hypothetical protein
MSIFAAARRTAEPGDQAPTCWTCSGGTGPMCATCERRSAATAYREAGGETAARAARARWAQ